MSDIHIYLEREQPVKVITLEPTGARGPVGPAGAAGPNSVTSATTSDGTAELSLESVAIGSGTMTATLDATQLQIINDINEVVTTSSGVVVASYLESGTSQAALTADSIQIGTEGVGSVNIYATGSADFSGDVTAANLTVNDILYADHIHGNLAGSVYAHVRAGEALTKGDPVYVSGSHGTAPNLIPIVSKADASNAAKMPAIGIMDADLANNANGHMVITGTITDLDTDDYAINTMLYVASGGGFTATPPAANSQPVARVERSNSNNGAVIVKVNGLASSGGNGVSDANKLVRFSSAGEIPVASVGGLGPGIADFLAAPTSANLAAAVADEQGSGKLQFANIEKRIITTTLTRNATTSSAIDSDFTVNITSGKSYIIEFMIRIVGTGGAQVINVDLTSNINASFVSAMSIRHNLVPTNYPMTSLTPVSSNITLMPNTANQDGTSILKMCLAATSTGTLSLKWGVTTSGSATRQAGSYVIVEEF